MNQFRIGDSVEVRSTFCTDWSPGFIIAEILEGEYRVKRVADQYVLPGVFAASMLRMDVLVAI